MKSRLACLVGVMFSFQAVAAQYRTALPGYHYEFPRDHFNHPEFQTEWWYYTGNVKSSEGHRFGFELTFFRQAVSRDPAKTAAWDLKDLFFAHLALSDLDGGKFYHAERTNRSGPGIAGADEPSGRIWNGNWQVVWEKGEQKLQAIDERFQLQLMLHSEKQPVIHGSDGVSQKAEGAGRASHYISLTRLGTSGLIELGGKKFEVTGTSWMDHEFFTHQLTADQTGWDWLSLQLEDNTELMLFHIRRKDGSIDPYSAGTFVDAQGKTTHLRTNDFVLSPLRNTWKSPTSAAVYPIEWKLAVPRLGLELEVKTPLESQELTSNTKVTPNYWEGAILLTGKRNGQAAGGVGYLEMTGYDRPAQLAPRGQ